jgi:hypothetical protein
MGFKGGYEETRLDENVFLVHFRGNGYTRMERAQDFVILRAAELTIESGYKYFAIASSDKSIATSYFTTPVQTQTKAEVRYYQGRAYLDSKTTSSGGDTYDINKPRITITIVCFKEKPDGPATMFSATFVAESIKKKYGIDESHR